MELLQPARLKLASWPKLDMAMVEKAIKATPSKTGLGFGRMAPALLERMPVEGKSELLELLSSMEGELMLPARALYNSVVLIDKPDGSDRPI
eukprot:217029-Heterocapsa_arctica.AAC.1